MPFFKYTAKNEHGETVHGKVEAQTVEQGAGMLHNRSLLVISIKSMKGDSFSAIQTALFGIKQDEIVIFTRQLATMITAGMTLIESLGILRQQSKSAMGKMTTELQREVEGGATFAKALESQGKTFSRVYIELVKAGEIAGVLQQILARLADTMEKEKQFKGQTRGALIYPVIVLLTMVGVGGVMMVFVVPRLTQMYVDLGIQLPLITQILIAVSNFLASYIIFILIAIAGGTVLFQRWKSTPSGELAFDRFMLKVPIMGPLREKVLITEFCRTMSLLLSAGISVLQVLDIISNALDNAVYRKTIAEVAKSVEKGVSLSLAMARYDIFPPILQQMVSVGEETGKLDDVMLKLSNYFESESEQGVKNLTTAFEPIVMIVLGIGVGVLVIAIIMPIYSLTTGL